MVNEISPAGSIRGWRFKVWAVRNIETFKLLGGTLAGLITFYTATIPAPWSVTIGALAAIFGKLILDALHFWASEVELK